MDGQRQDLQVQSAASTWTRAPKNTRVRVLVEIAERYHELVDPLNGPGESVGTGELLSLMPRTYTATVKEFERLVKLLRVEERELWGHVNGWWLSATTRTVWLCPRCGPCHQSEHVHQGRKTGKPLTVKCRRVRQWRRATGARESLALEGLNWVADRWGLGTEPMLPSEILVYKEAA